MNELQQFKADTRQVFGVDLKGETIEECRRELESMKDGLAKKNVREGLLPLPKTLDKAARTVDCVIATETPVIRFDWKEWEYYDEVLLVDGCDLAAAKDGIPFLNQHSWHGGVKALLGTTVNLRVEDGVLVGTRKFADTDIANDAFSLISGGHLRNQSIGYRIESVMELQPGKKATMLGREFSNDGKRKAVYATRWTALEDSAVIIPADPNAGVRSDDGDMLTRDFNVGGSPIDKQQKRSEEEMNKGNDDNKDTGAIGAGGQQPDVAAERQQAIELERQRNIEITEMCRQHGISNEKRDGYIKDGMAVEDARKAVLDELSKRTAEQPAPPAGKLEVKRDHMDAVIPAMRDAMLVSAGLVKREDADKGASDFAHLNTRDFCLAFLEERGEKVKRGMLPDEIMERVMSTGDFPLLLQQVGVDGVQRGLQEAPETYKEIADTSGSLSNLNPSTVSRAIEHLELLETKEAEESKYYYFGETGDTVRLSKFTRAVAFTEETIINDQLGEFTRKLGEIGKAVGRLEGDLVYDWLLDPPNVGNTPFFHATHRNLAAAGAALGEASIGDALTALATQLDVDGKMVSLDGKFLVVPRVLEQAAKKILMSQVYSDGSAAATQWNTIRGAGLQLVSERRIDARYAAAVAAGTGTYPWFVLAPKGSTVKLFYLNGKREPVVTRWVDNMRDAITVRIKHRVTSHASAWQAFYKNPGV